MCLSFKPKSISKGTQRFSKNLLVTEVNEGRTKFDIAIQMETINPKWIALRNAISIPFKMQSFMFIHINLPTMVQLMRLYTLKLVCNLYLI